MSQKSDPTCPVRLKAAKDALEAISGKWRIPIIIALLYGGKRFGEIQKDIVDISPKMLAKELQELELNKLITRTVYDSKPVSIEYKLTTLGKSLKRLMDEIQDWGTLYRKQVIGSKTK